MVRFAVVGDTHFVAEAAGSDPWAGRRGSAATLAAPVRQTGSTTPLTGVTAVSSSSTRHWHRAMRSMRGYVGCSASRGYDGGSWLDTIQLSRWDGRRLR